MDMIKIVKSPTTIFGRMLKFGAIYGRIDGITYTVENYEYADTMPNTLRFYVWKPEEVIRTKKHGSYVRGGYWHIVNSLNVGKYANIVRMCNEYIYAHKLWLRQPSDYVRNSEIAATKGYIRKNKVRSGMRPLPSPVIGAY